MSSSDAITLWLKDLKRGDQSAAHGIYDRYEKRLIRLAREKLGGAPRRAADEEDVVLGAFDSFFRGVEKNRFTKLDDRQDLWKLLVRITVCKCWDLIEHELRQKRGGGKVRGESALDVPAGSDPDTRGIEQVFDREPTPAEAAELADETERLLAMLPDELRWRWRRIAGHSKCLILVAKLGSKEADHEQDVESQQVTLGAARVQ